MFEQQRPSSSSRESGMNATVLRPWYVLGKGHRWPYVLLPMYWLFERILSTPGGRKALGLVTLEQMKWALVHAVENPILGVRIVEVPEIRHSVAFLGSNTPAENLMRPR